MTTENSKDSAWLEQVGLGQQWEWKNGSWWSTPADFDLRANTEKMLALGARFVAITAMETGTSPIRLDYQWDLRGQLLSFIMLPESRVAATIADLTPAADWAERETHEYFAVEFTGRRHTRPLMTRAGDAVGIHLRQEAAQ
jgi:hypothetical protein